MLLPRSRLKLQACYCKERAQDLQACSDFYGSTPRPHSGNSTTVLLTAGNQDLRVLHRVFDCCCFWDASSIRRKGTGLNLYVAEEHEEHPEKLAAEPVGKCLTVDCSLFFLTQGCDMISHDLAEVSPYLSIHPSLPRRPALVAGGGS